MDQVRTVGLDIAKNVFQVHGIDETGVVVIRRQVRRRQVLTLFRKLPPSLVGIEACATAHYWARELATRSGVGRENRRPSQYDRRGVPEWRKISANGLPDTGKPKNQAIGWLRRKLSSLDGGTGI
jgi:hypothetical protein